MRIIMTKVLYAIEMLETRTIHSKQRKRGETLIVGEDITHVNATYFIARKEAKAVYREEKGEPESGAEIESEADDTVEETPLEEVKKTPASKPARKKAMSKTA